MHTNKLPRGAFQLAKLSGSGFWIFCSHSLQECSAGPQPGEVLELLAPVTAFGGLKTAFGRYSPSNASQAYGLQTPSDALPPYALVASTVPSLLI